MALQLIGPTKVPLESDTNIYYLPRCMISERRLTAQR